MTHFDRQVVMWIAFLFFIFGIMLSEIRKSPAAVDPKPNYRDLGVEWVKCIDRKKRIRHGDCVKEHRRWM